VLVRFVEEDLLPKTMLWSDALKVIWLGDYFKISELVTIMLNTFVIPQIDTQNAIQLVNESYAKLKSLGNSSLSRNVNNFVLNDLTPTSSIVVNQEKEEDSWYRLLDDSLNFISRRNPLMILKEQKTQHKVPKVILEEIAERVHKKQYGQPDRQMLKFLMSVKQLPSMLHLAKSEYDKLNCPKNVEKQHPNLTWEVSGLNINLVKESDPFVMNGTTWVLSVWYVKESLQIGLKKAHGDNPVSLFGNDQYIK
jgi:hypothetical protein